MTRVASLYLPHWSIDRLRRAERARAPRPDAAPASLAAPAFDELGRIAADERAGQCSVPATVGWRPGARWARGDGGGSGPGASLADTRGEVEAAVAALPAHRRPPQRELGRVSEQVAAPFRARRGDGPAPARDLSRRTQPAPPPFAAGGAETRAAALARAAAMPPVQWPGEDARGRAELRGPTKRLTSRDGHAGEASSPPAPSPAAALARAAFPLDSAAPARAATPLNSTALARLAAMPAVLYPGEGPHPDDHGRSEPTAPSCGQGRFFQTGRSLSDLVSRVSPDAAEEPAAATSDDAPAPLVPPLVTVAHERGRATIAAACPAALALGLVPGTALTQARALAPGLAVRPADPAGDAADLARLALARRWTPTVAPSGPDMGGDGLLLDLTGVAHLHGGEERMARRLVRLLARRGITARVAVADTAGAAWALARFGDVGPASPRPARTRGGPQPGGNGQGAPGWSHAAATPAMAGEGTGAVRIAPPGGHAAALAPLPVAALRIDAPARDLLARLGVDTVGQLAAMPRGPLARRFGPALLARLDQASGRLPEPLDPVTPVDPVVARQVFAEPIATAEAIAYWLAALAPRLADALARAGLGARVVELVADRVDGVPQRLRIGLARPSRDPAHLLRLLARRIEEIEPGYGIDSLALHVRRADPLGPETLAPHLAEEAPPDLAPLIDALANRVGANRLWRCAAVESDVPERSVAAVPPLDPPAAAARAGAADDVRRLDGRERDHPWHPRWPRPVWLLRRPEPVGHVLAGLPDQPPARFTWRGRVHRVVRADGPERIAGEWWRRAGEAHAVRDYFHVEDEAGARFWLYRRGDGVRTDTGDLAWFLHGRFG